MNPAGTLSSAHITIIAQVQQIYRLEYNIELVAVNSV